MRLEQLLPPTSWLSASSSVTAGHGWEGSEGLLYDHPEVCLSTSLPWNCSPTTRQDGFLTLSFLINSSELPGQWAAAELTGVISVLPRSPKGVG